MINPISLRADFPLLQTESHRKPFVYLDSAATSIKPRQVIEAERDYYENYGVNIHRGLYEFSAKATAMFQQCRETVADFIGANNASSIIFTSGSTASSNLFADSWLRPHLNQGDRVITTMLEHHSTLVPLQQACLDKGAQLDFIPYNSETGELDLSSIESILTGAKVLVCTAMANATGYMPPIQYLISIAQRLGVPVAIDGAQYVSHHPVNVQTENIDFLWFSAHKMLGPTGLGVLYVRPELLQAMRPVVFGGDMIERVWPRESTWAGIPERFEAGTPNIAAAIGFDVALRYLKSLGMEQVFQHEKKIMTYLWQKLSTFEDIEVYGPLDRSKIGGVFSFNLKGIHSHDTGTILDAQAVAVRSGFHCAMPYMDLLGIAGSVRASIYLYTSTDDIDRLFQGILETKALFA